MGPAKDPLLAACLCLGGHRQIEACKFAMTKLTHDECKAFAKAEIEEHETIKAKLKEQGYEPPSFAAAAPAGPVPPGAPAQPGPGVAGMVGKFHLPPGAADLLKVDAEVVEQCIANYRKEMEQKQGVKLDKAFVGDQLHEHMGLLDKVQVFQRHASPAMKPVLAEGQGVIEKHIATLKTLMEKLDATR